MIKKYFALFTFVLVTAIANIAMAQPATSGASTTPPQQPGDQNVTANFVIGEVKAIDTNAKQLIVKTDAGSLVTAILSDSTLYMRVAPGETNLNNAAKITFADVGEGDRVMARGKVSDDKKVVPARAIVVMTKADLAKKHEAERAEWRRRGILGVISGINPATKEITISSRSLAGAQSVVIPVAENVDIRRYAPDSIKFSDAKPGKLDELKVGDQLRALGERSTDGTRFTAEKIVTGSFRTVVGAVTAIDAATGEIKINDQTTKQPLTIVVKQDSVLRRFPAGEMMLGRPGGAPGAATGGGAAGGQAAGGPAVSGGPGGTGIRAGAGGGGNIQDMLERLPTVALADVKVGETIIVSSTKGADPSRLTAISLVSGADTLLNMMAARQAQAGGPTPANPAGGLGSGIQFGIGLP